MTTTSSIDLSRYDFVDTAIGGVKNRNNVMRFDDFKPSSDESAFTTILRYDEGLLTHWQTHKNNGHQSVGDYRGDCLALVLPFDIDRKDNPDAALADARRLLLYLEATWDIPPEAVDIVFSGGKGYHLSVPSTLFGGFDPSSDTPDRLKRLAIALVGELGD